MGKMNRRFFEKLIEKVGWDSILYDALKDLYCDTVNDSPNQEDTLDEVKELLEVYEEYVKDGSSKTDIVSVADQTSSDKLGEVLIDSQHSKSLAPPERNEERDIVYRVTVLSPLGEESKPSPKPMRAVVQMDKDLGQSQGELPIPGNCYIVNRDKLQVVTKAGLLLGKSDENGQIKGPESKHVSGYIRTNGRYDLVFQDPKLGEALVVYEVLQERKSKELELEMTNIKVDDVWMSFVRNPEVLTKADTLKKSMELLLDTLKREHNMNVISVTAMKVPKEFEDTVKNKPKM